MGDDKFFSLLNMLGIKYGCGLDTRQELAEIAKSLVKHPVSKKHYDKFVASGGQFYLTNKIGLYAMAYLPTVNITAVGHDYFFAPMEPEEAASLFSHEMHHAYTSLAAKEKGFDLADYDKHYTEKSRQIIHQGLEIGATYHQLVSGFEIGGIDWDFIRYIREYEANGIETLLNNNKIYAGDKIPKEYLGAVADIVAVTYPQVTGVKCKTTSLSFLENSLDNEFGTQEITCKKLFEFMEMPTTFNENQLESLLLFDRRFLPFMSDEFKKIVSMAPYGHKPAIQNRLNWHFLPVVRAKENIRD